MGIYFCPGTFHQTSADTLLRTSRVSSMAHEEGSLPRGICFLQAIEKHRITSCEGLVLCSQTTSRGVRHHYRFQLYRKILWTFHCPTCSPGDFGKLCRYDRPTDVRHQYHCILFFIYLRGRWLFCEVCATRILGIRTRELALRLSRCLGKSQKCAKDLSWQLVLDNWYIRQTEFIVIHFS